MTDEIKGQVPESGETPEPSNEQNEKFDSERAMRTIRAQREEFKTLKAELEAIKLKAEREKLSETERLTAERDELKAKLAQAEQTANERALKGDIILNAAKLGFNDPADAWAMIDRGTLGDNIEEALTALAKSKPYLLKTTPTTQAASTAPKASTGNPARTALTMDAVKNMTADQVAANWSQIEPLLKGG
jgi:regulator of replication initiation timing